MAGKASLSGVLSVAIEQRARRLIYPDGSLSKTVLPLRFRDHDHPRHCFDWSWRQTYLFGANRLCLPPPTCPPTAFHVGWKDTFCRHSYDPPASRLSISFRSTL